MPAKHSSDILADEERAVIRWDEQGDQLAQTTPYLGPDAHLDTERQSV